MLYSKYWIVEHNEGMDGMEFEEAKNYEEALSMAKTYFYEIYDLYPVTKRELYFSELDIY